MKFLFFFLQDKYDRKNIYSELFINHEQTPDEQAELSVYVWVSVCVCVCLWERDSVWACVHVCAWERDFH